ncbi:hypothetical protein ACEWY4_007246 [Coilia grayii]|uniref:Ig-like domain-containing protein n=1 Tax=Coilia grayii TaxID=363190 RepID=A0ABD1KFR6_9TELE
MEVGKVIWWLLLYLPDCQGAPIPDTFTVSGPDGPLSVWMGSSVILPCSVSPAFTDSLELRWHRPEKFKTPVLLYEKQQTQEQPADPQYRGRVSLTGELEKGNVSLKVENVTMADSGEYICFVAGKMWYEQARVYIIVKATGTHPVLSVADGGSGQVNVSCVSDGWFPKPTLTWRQQGGTEISQSFDTTIDAQGLVSVTSQLLLPLSKLEWLSCSVGLPGQEKKESRLFLSISALQVDDMKRKLEEMENKSKTRENELRRRLAASEAEVERVANTGPWKERFIVCLCLWLLTLTVILFLHLYKKVGFMKSKDSKQAALKDETGCSEEEEGLMMQYEGLQEKVNKNETKVRHLENGNEGLQEKVNESQTKVGNVEDQNTGTEVDPERDQAMDRGRNIQDSDVDGLTDMLCSIKIQEDAKCPKRL